MRKCFFLIIANFPNCHCRLPVLLCAIRAPECSSLYLHVTPPVLPGPVSGWVCSVTPELGTRTFDCVPEVGVTYSYVCSCV